MSDSILRVDLHTHSNASDGELTPVELVRLALERGLTTIALTDHDSVENVGATIDAARGTPLQVIPGVELSADVPKGEVHVLGYFVDWHDPEFLAMLVKFRDGRYGRAEKMAKKLGALGASISFDRVKEIAGDAAIGRPHVAQALVEAGYVGTVTEAFTKYISRDGPAYVPRFRLTPEDAVALILSAGGVPVLAHPREMTGWIFPLMKAGLLGLEVYYGAYDDMTRAELARLAKQYGLIATGGSDFHGLDKMGHRSGLGQNDVPPGVVEKLRKRADAVKQENGSRK
jgi:3',5'-nucleoside bisphosphate phosphatase